MLFCSPDGESHESKFGPKSNAGIQRGIRARHISAQLDQIFRLAIRRQGLPEPLRSRISELTDDQFVGLRFASDAELPALVKRALDEKLSRADIKKAVTTWRPDYSRV